MTDKLALKRIAVNVRRRRLEAGLSMNELAKRIDHYAPAVKRIEDEESMPGLGMATRIAEALGCTVDDLLQEPQKILSHAS